MSDVDTVTLAAVNSSNRGEAIAHADELARLLRRRRMTSAVYRNGAFDHREVNDPDADAALAAYAEWKTQTTPNASKGTAP